MLPPLSSGASSRSISKDFPPLIFHDFIKASLQNHSNCAQRWCNLDGNQWLLWTLCFGFKFSLSIQSAAFAWPGYVKLCARPLSYYFGYNASVSWLLQKGEMLPSVSNRICRVGKRVVRIRSSWGEQQFIKEQRFGWKPGFILNFRLWDGGIRVSCWGHRDAFHWCYLVTCSWQVTRGVGSGVEFTGLSGTSVLTIVGSIYRRVHSSHNPAERAVRWGGSGSSVRNTEALTSH